MTRNRTGPRTGKLGIASFARRRTAAPALVLFTLLFADLGRSAEAQARAGEAPLFRLVTFQTTGSSAWVRLKATVRRTSSTSTTPFWR
jgi:hypothetical protein